MNPGIYTLTVRASFSAAHRLREYDGNCERLHGHNWQVEVSVASEQLDDRGIALDFRAIKAAVNELLSGFDHRYLNEVPPFDRQNPSSENVARYLFEEMERKVPAPARVARVTVWESEDARADYSRPD
ncbi:MAG: Queuosine biosynthesis QueD [Deltaproteobacteria bacterium]|jgi:6-pyruvoyltetrahydropterin/6-carboxytetrahydropterin synthase|nr:Queuosine biosynthesis QueD [Deltaproteobacteria bacterium]